MEEFEQMEVERNKNLGNVLTNSREVVSDTDLTHSCYWCYGGGFCCGDP